MAVDADGAAVLVCRYVCPVPLPPNLAQLVAGGGAAAEAGGVEALMLKLARFVAHVSVWCVVPVDMQHNTHPGVQAPRMQTLRMDGRQITACLH